MFFPKTYALTIKSLRKCDGFFSALKNYIQLLLAKIWATNA